MSKFEIVSGVEGMCLYIDETRVAGPKPWGGGTIVDAFTTDERYVPERTCRMTFDETASGDEIYPTKAYICSECGVVDLDGPSRYCPNCGARVEVE